MDHDRLFKELLTTFFAEFMALFFPQAHRYLDYDHLEFLSQEVFTDVTAGERSVVDILARTRVRGEEGHVLIHVEPQSYREESFNRRMFKYFARLHEKYREKVLPIAVFAHDLKQAEPDSYEVGFPFLQVLRFQFLQVHLKRLSWREYLKHPNPVAAALLSKMDYSEAEKVQVKLEFLKMLVRLKLDPARMQLLAGFFDSYLVLTVEEEAELQGKLAAELPAKEAKQVEEILTSWHKRGIEEGLIRGRMEGRMEGLQEGRKEGQCALLMRLARKRFGALPVEIEERIRSLSAERLELLAEEMLSLTELAELEHWLTRPAG